MLCKINRIKKKKDFEVIFKKGKSFKNSFLLFKTLPNNLKDTRFGFVVSNKVSKKAVVRNKIRRRMGEVIRLNLNDIKKGIDVVIVVLPGFEKKDFTETKEVLNKILRELNLI